ncbi:glycosyltransferase [Calothrix sp. UHCC 0171]|uniref:glycosyltransferase n=1 Tax=Calothrix sp. UHCC 0171 TaxID=3110245 RepID=UPI002B1FE1BB|nr:glycosyltransferase [Calothrix sp. UHCC 0171]MEA5573573.1 glycosyltransferase [Calothrix sp. UHCC 0171]
MGKISKPKLVFFQGKPNRHLANFIKLHRLQHVKCLSEFFEVILIQENCDYQQICDKYQPELTLFENPGNFPNVQKIEIKNTHAYSEIPKLGFYNEDAWCSSRKDFISDMECWGIETFFSICTTIAEYIPEIRDNLFVWPNFIDAEIYKDYGAVKNIPMLLTGASYELYPWRQKIYKLVSQYYPSLICPHLGYSKASKFRMLYGEQYARTINASWFVPTCGTVAKEVVRKHFEIPASKACLMTEKSPSLEAAGFVDMENCIFVDESNVIDKIDYLFQNLEKLEGIIDAGYQLVHSRHTLKQRDQVFQWFNLYKNIKSDQKIIQTNPFEKMTVVDKSSGIRSLPIFRDGLNINLLHQGDEKLWSDRYEEAEELYLKCLNYVGVMPEPKFKLALCNLYKGDAKTALEWLVPIIKPNLENGQVPNPDPVEWAYCIISLLCLGKFDEAIGHANRFPSLKHPELNRVRWIIDILKNRSNKPSCLHDELIKTHYSIHKIPERSFNEWVEQLCIMLNSCQQFDLVEILIKYVAPDPKSSQSVENISGATFPLLKSGKLTKIFSSIAYMLNPYPFRNSLIVKGSRIIFSIRKKLAIKTRLLYLLNRL